MPTTIEEAISKAAEIGAEHGANAAAWWQQDAIGGRVSSQVDTADVARRVLAGIEDGDPAIMDGLPYADLSGEWADGLTPASLAEVCDLPRDAADAYLADDLDALCDAYAESFNMRAQGAVESYCAAEIEGAS